MRAQTVGSWETPVQFAASTLGCGGSPEAVYGVHAHLIPVGVNRGKVLIWGRGLNAFCWSVHAPTSPGTYDQRFAIVDADANPVTITQGVWTIPASAAPPVYAGSASAGGFTATNGLQTLFCGGHCWLPDGRLFVAGGTDNSKQYTHPWLDYMGSRIVAIYDPNAGPMGTWSTATQLLPPTSFLEAARWYPTVLTTVDVTAPNRRVKVLVLGGIEQQISGPDPIGDMAPNGVFFGNDRAYITHEAYDIDETPTGWSITKDMRPGGVLPPISGTPNQVNGLFLGPTSSPPSVDYPLGHSLFYYARAHFLSNGVFGGGPAFAGGLTWVGGMPMFTTWIDHPTNPNSWPLPNPALPVPTPHDMLEEPTGVLLPASLAGGEDRIALFGGQFGLNHAGPTPVITELVHVLDARAAAPGWNTSAIPRLNHARKFANSVLLPDSSVLIVGGGTNSGHGATGGEVFTPEVFRGAGWQNGPPEGSPRTYHSCALLLPSGRVLSIGGDTRTRDMQVYRPHYWTTGATRPVINTSPATLAYASTFPVTFTLAPGRTLAKASLTTPGSLTHSYDPNQRIVELSIVSSTSTSASLATPLDATRAPFGHYMLWLVDSAGEVSTAAWTRF